MLLNSPSETARWAFEGARRDLADHARAALLGAQDRECAEQAAENPHSKAKRELQEIWMAETKANALTAFDVFEKTYAVKYEKAVACLIKDRHALLAFYDFPAEHWKHLRTTNPIESTFATVRHRTIRTKGCLSNDTAIAMVFKLLEAAQRSWRRLDGTGFLPKVIYGVKFKDGIEEQDALSHPQAKTAAA